MSDPCMTRDRPRRRPPWEQLFAQVVIASALAVSAACGSGQTEPAAPTTSAPEAPRVTGEQARALVAAGAVLLDVSPADRFPTTRIEGAINIPIGELGSRMSELPRDRPIVVYCGGGRASPRAASALVREGYDARLLGARSNW